MTATRKVITVRYENPRPPELFWREITLDGLKVRVDAGRTNTQTQALHRYEKPWGERFATPAEAKARFDALVAESASRFQKRTMREDERPAREEGLGKSASNAALEARVFEGGRGDASAAAVYADWLQTQGDPRGELAALHQAGKTAEASAWLAANADRVFGELDVRLEGEIYDLRWELGFLRGASLKRRGYDSRTDLAELTRALLALPAARFVSALRFGLASYESDNDWGPTLAAVASSAQAPQLTSLRFDDYTSEDCELSWAPFGDFSPHWRSLPALEELRVRSGAGGTLGEIDLPALRTLVRESGGLSAAELASIVAARCPRLEHLEIWLGSSDYGAEGTLDHVLPILDGRRFPALTRLGLVNTELTPSLIAPIAASPLLPKLRVLDLSKGVLADDDVDELLARADAFRHLERLDLSENLLADRIRDIVARLPNAVLDDQRADDLDEDMRFVAVGE